MAKLNKIQKYAILWLNHSSWSTEKIAEELDIPEKQVQTAISSVDNTNKVKTKSEPVGNSQSKNMMIRETANKKSHVSIMTKESSMINDEAKKKRTSTVKQDTPGIYRPNGN